MKLYVVTISGKVEDVYTSYRQALEESGLNYWLYRKKIGQIITSGETIITPVELTKQRKGKHI